MTKTILITLHEDNTMSVNAKGSVSYPEMTMALGTAQLHAMCSTYDGIKAAYPDKTEDELKTLKGHIYDIYNGQASLILDKFAPDIELHKDLTVDALLKAENELLDEYN